MSPRVLRALRATLLASGLFPWAIALLGLSAVFFPQFRALCHQRPERTLLIFGAPMVVCSRCAGVYAGVALGALVPLGARLVDRGRALVLAAVALAVVDVATQDLGLHAPFHPTRLATGLLMGYAASAFMVGWLVREARQRRAPSAAGELAPAKNGTTH